MRPREATRAARVLVISNGGPDAANTVARSLQRLPQRAVRIAHNTEEALNLLGASTWEAVFWAPRGSVLPGESGLAQIRSRQPGAAVIAVVEPQDLGAAAEVLQAGATSYLVLGPQTEVILPAVLDAAIFVAALHARADACEAASRSLEARLRIISELCHEAILVASPAGSIVEVNRVLSEMVQAPAENLLGRNVSQLLRPEHLFEKIAAALADPGELGRVAEWGGAGIATEHGPVIVGLEGFVRQERGAYLLCSVSAAAVRGADNELQQIVLTLATTQQEKLLSQELSASRSILDLVLSSVSEAIALVDLSGAVTRANARLADLVGSDNPHACLGQQIDELLGSRGQMRELVRECISRRGEVRRSLEVQKPDGAVALVEATAAALFRGDQAEGAVVVLAGTPEEPPRRPPGLDWASGALAAIRYSQAVERAQTSDDARHALSLLAEWLALLFGGGAAVVTARGIEGDLVTGSYRLPSEVAERVAKAALAAAEAPEREGLDIVAVPDIEAHVPQARDKQAVTMLLASGFHTMVLLPLKVGAKVIGAAVVAGADVSLVDTEIDSAQTRAVCAHIGALISGLHSRLQAVENSRRARLLSEAAARIATAEGVRGILEAGASALRDMLNADWAAFYALDRQGVEIQDGVAVGAEGEARGIGVPADALEIAWEAMRAPRPILRKADDDGKRTSVLAVHLRSDDEAVGAAVVGWRKDVELSPDEMAVVQNVAAQVGNAIRQHRLYREQASLRSEMEVAAAEAMRLEARARAVLQAAAAAAELTELHDILAALCDAALRTVGLDEVTIFLADQQAGELRIAARASAQAETQLVDEKTPLRRGASVYADAALSEAPYLLAPVTEGDETYEVALVPLRTRAALVGLIAGSRRASGREITPQDLRLLRALGSIAAVAIDRARVDQLRETMTHSISHELRAPLASIRAYTELVLEEGAGPINDEQRTFLQRAVNACIYLEQLIGDLLELSRLRSGQVELKPQLVDVGELVQQVLNSLQQRIDQAEVDVSVEIASDARELYVDRMRLAQILTNIIDNAIKFNYRGGRVAIEARRDGANAVISVTDTGPGIPAEEQEAIFREFYRGKSEFARSRTGAGLGLAIARQLAELLGGEITIDSEVGRGSTFSLRLPLRRQPDVADPGGTLEVTAGGAEERPQDTDRG
ncbi:MAG: GAF domain-containing protein [Armatimonadetes bacterium]|nr:GAF domain-containing protein [Armatimonadota bacterium]